MEDCVDLLDYEALEKLSVSIKALIGTSELSCNVCSKDCFSSYLKKMMLSLYSSFSIAYENCGYEKISNLNDTFPIEFDCKS